jgi:hypothetical protein
MNLYTRSLTAIVIFTAAPVGCCGTRDFETTHRKAEDLEQAKSLIELSYGAS